MGRTQNKQAGFNIVELLVIVVAVGVIGVGGWFVYQHNRPKPTGATGGTQTTDQTTSQQTSTTAYFTIPEWGVRVPYSGTLKLSYTMSSDGKTATFSSDQLTALSSDCVGRGGWITRWASTDKISEGTPDANAPTAEQAFAGKDPSIVPYAHIGNYYFTFSHDQAACGDPSVTAALYSQTNNAVKALVPNLQQ